MTVIDFILLVVCPPMPDYVPPRQYRDIDRAQPIKGANSGTLVLHPTKGWRRIRKNSMRAWR